MTPRRRMIGFLEAETTALSRNVGKQLRGDVVSFRRRTDISATQVQILKHFPGLSLQTRHVVKNFKKRVVVQCLCLRLPKVASREILVQVDSDLNTINKGFCWLQ